VDQRVEHLREDEEEGVAVGFHEDTSGGQENIKDPDAAEPAGEAEAVGGLALNVLEVVGGRVEVVD